MVAYVAFGYPDEKIRQMKRVINALTVKGGGFCLISLNKLLCLLLRHSFIIDEMRFATFQIRISLELICSWILNVDKLWNYIAGHFDQLDSVTSLP